MKFFNKLECRPTGNQIDYNSINAPSRTQNLTHEESSQSLTTHFAGFAFFWNPQQEYPFLVVPPNIL